MSTTRTVAEANSGLRVDCALRRGSFALAARCDVPPGVTVLLGPSGAGKSLTLQAIAGLLTPDAGRITLDERTLLDRAAGVNLPARLRRVGYVPQFSALFPHLSIGENVAYGLPSRQHTWWRPGRPAIAREKEAARVEDLLALVRLPGFAARMPATLSGGQARRVALARALASEPRALLLDEPLSALDAPTRAALRTDLRAVLAASGIPTLFVTHDLDEARALADRLVVLIAGRVVASGPLADVLATPPTAEAALLLGWENVLPLAGIDADGASLRATLPGGQTLTLPTRAPSDAKLCIREVGGTDLSPQPPPLKREGEPEAVQHLAGCTSKEMSAQADIVAQPSAAVSTAGAPTPNAVALALRADRLHIEPAGSPVEPGFSLTGLLLDLTDYGPYLALTVALAGAEAGTALRVTCSPREVAALGLTPGDVVHVCVPSEAARLVRQV